MAAGSKFIDSAAAQFPRAGAGAGREAASAGAMSTDGRLDLFFFLLADLLRPPKKLCNTPALMERVALPMTSPFNTWSARESGFLTLWRSERERADAGKRAASKRHRRAKV